MQRWNSGQSPVAPQVDGVDVSKVMVSAEEERGYPTCDSGENAIVILLTRIGGMPQFAFHQDRVMFELGCDIGGRFYDR